MMQFSSQGPTSRNPPRRSCASRSRVRRARSLILAGSWSVGGLERRSRGHHHRTARSGHVARAPSTWRRSWRDFRHLVSWHGHRDAAASSGRARPRRAMGTCPHRAPRDGQIPSIQGATEVLGSDRYRVLRPVAATAWPTSLLGERSGPMALLGSPLCVKFTAQPTARPRTGSWGSGGEWVAAEYRQGVQTKIAGRAVGPAASSLAAMVVPPCPGWPHECLCALMHAGRSISGLLGTHKPPRP